MISLLLISHVLIAISSLVIASRVVYMAFMGEVVKSEKSANKMWISTIATLISGIVLVAATSAPLGSACLTMASFLFVVVAFYGYSKILLRSTNNN